MAGVADEEVREDGGDFPEDEHQDEVICGNQTKHGTGKAEEVGELAGVAGGVLEVAGAVEEHQGAYAQDQQTHNPGEGVHAEGERHVQLGNPLVALAPGGATENLAGLGQNQGEHGSWDRGQQVEG